MKNVGIWILMALSFSAGVGHATLKTMHDLASERVMLEAKQAYSKYTEFVMTESYPLEGYLSRADGFLTYSMFTSSAIPQTQTFPCFSFGVQMGTKDLFGKFEKQETLVRDVCVMGSEVVDRSKVPDLQILSRFYHLRLHCSGQENGIMRNAKHSFDLTSLNLETEKPELMRTVESYYVDGKYKFVTPKYCSMNFVQGLLECEYSVDGNNARLDIDYKRVREYRSYLCDFLGGSGCIKHTFSGKINYGRAKADVQCE